jgi:phage-related protein
MTTGPGADPEDRIKPLFWIASSRDDLRKFPEDVKDTMGFALFQAQKGGKHVAAKPLKGFSGAGVLEIVEDDVAGTFRAVYTVKFSGAVYVLHAFQKKSKKRARTPKEEIDRVKKRLTLAEEQYRQWRLAQREKEGPR